MTMFAKKDTPSPTLSERSAKDGRHCDLCGSPNPAVRCEKCGGHCFCLSCDDMYHRHPKRKSHQRKATESVMPAAGAPTTRRPTTAPGDPSKMPIPPPRKKKGRSIFASLSGSSGGDIPALPKKEFSLTEKLGSIRRFMSNRPLPPIPKEQDGHIGPRGSGSPRMPSSPSTQNAPERTRTSKSPKSKTPSEDGFPSNRPTSPQYQNILSHLTKLAQSSCEEWDEEPSTSGSARGSSGGEEGGGWGQETRTSRHLRDPPPLYPAGRNQRRKEEPQWTGMGTLRRGQAGFMHPTGVPMGAAPGMHHSTSATDLTDLVGPHQQPAGPQGHIPGYPYMYPPGVPPLFPHFAPAQSMGRLNYPYFGGSWANMKNKGTDADEEDEDEDDVDAKRNTLTRRRHSESKMKRSQSVMYDPSMMPPGAFFPFGGMPPPGFPGYMPPPGAGYPYWGHPDAVTAAQQNLQAPPSPSASVRSLTRPHGRTRRRPNDDESSVSSYGGGSGSRAPLGPGRGRRKPEDTDRDLSSEDETNVQDRKNLNSETSTIKRMDRTGSVGSNPSSATRNPGRHNPGSPTPGSHNPGSHNPGSHNPGNHNPGSHNPGSSNPGNPNPGNPTPENSNPVNPNPPGVPATPWECEFCTFINPAGSRICGICCKSIGIPHHEADPATEQAEIKKGINMTEISEDVIKEQEQIEKEIRRQLEVKQKLSEESPGELQKSSASTTDEIKHEIIDNIPSALSTFPLSSDRIDITEDSEWLGTAEASTQQSKSAEIETQTEILPSEIKSTDLVKDKTKSETVNKTSNTQSTSTEIETQTEQLQDNEDRSSAIGAIPTVKTGPAETVDVTVQASGVNNFISVEEQNKPVNITQIIAPTTSDSSCQTNGDLPLFQKDVSVRPKTIQIIPYKTESLKEADKNARPSGLHVEMGTSPPPQDYFQPIPSDEPEPYERKERFGLLQRSLSQTSLNADRDFRRKGHQEEGFGQLIRSLSRGSLTSEPGGVSHFAGPHGKSSRSQYSAFAPVGSGPRSLYTSDWNLHRRTDWDEDSNRNTRPSGTGSWQTGNMNRRKSEYFLEELAEKRRQEKMRSQGLEMVRIVRKAEQNGFAPDDLQVALANCGDQDPVDWLEENWRNMIETVVTLATNYGHDKPDNDVGIISAGEARTALRLHKGNIWAAVTECVETRQRKYLDIQRRGNYTRREIITALTAQQGDTELAYEDLRQQAPQFSERVWEPQDNIPDSDEPIFEPRTNQIGNSAFFNQRAFPVEKEFLSPVPHKPEFRRSSLIDSYAPTPSTNTKLPRRFSFSSGLTSEQKRLSPNEYYLEPKSSELSDDRSINSEDIEDAENAEEQFQDHNKPKDRLSRIKGRRTAQKEVKRSSSFLDKLASLRKDKKQERNQNESRFLRYGSLNVLDMGGLRQSSFEEAMSMGDIEPKMETQPAKRGFLSRLMNRSPAAEDRAPKSEFFVQREGQKPMFEYPGNRITQEYPVMMENRNLNQLLAETSAIEKVQAYLNQIPGNQTPQTESLPHPLNTPFPMPSTAQNTLPITSAFNQDANQLSLMLQKLGLLPQTSAPLDTFPKISEQQTHPDNQQSTIPEPVVIKPVPVTNQGSDLQEIRDPIPPVSNAQVIETDFKEPQLMPENVQQPAIQDYIDLQHPPALTDNVRPTSISPPLQKEEAIVIQSSEVKERINNNSLKAQWLGVNLKTPENTVDEIKTSHSPKDRSPETAPVEIEKRIPAQPKARTATERKQNFSSKRTEVAPPRGIIKRDRGKNIAKEEIVLDHAPEDVYKRDQPIDFGLQSGKISVGIIDVKRDVEESLAEPTRLETEVSIAENIVLPTNTLDQTILENIIHLPEVTTPDVIIHPEILERANVLDRLQDFRDTIDVSPTSLNLDPQNLLSVRPASATDFSSSISDSIPETDGDYESTSYTDIDTTELAIEEYVQSIVSDNFKFEPIIPEPITEKPAPPPIEEKEIIEVEEVPVKQTRRRSRSRENSIKQSSSPVSDIQKEFQLPELTYSDKTSTLGTTNITQLQISSVKPQNATVSNNNVELETETLNKSEKIEELKTAVVKKNEKASEPKIAAVKKAEKTVGPKTAVQKKNEKIEDKSSLSVTKAPESQNSLDVPKAAEISKAQPEQTTVAATSSTTRVRRQRSISRDRRLSTALVKDNQEAVKEPVFLRRRSSTKENKLDPNLAVAKVEPSESGTGRKSLKDTKKVGSAESRLDRYRKSTKSPDKQGKPADSQASQGGTVMSAKRLAFDNRVKELLSNDQCATYEQAEMAARLMEMNFEETEALHAAKECGSLYQAISFLQQDCELCAGKFNVSEMVSMLHCIHRACRECLKAYFSIQIRDRNILELLCPFCNEPDLTDEETAADYFNHMDHLLKNLVDLEIHELFHRKLRDRTLMKDPNFRWCSQCSSGFIINNPNQKRLLCPDCKAVTCSSCRKLWEKQHEGISCEQFQEWKEANDPELQAAGLAQHLAENGIDCPNCRFRYSLAKGGCMHFRCLQCQWDFCSGCSRPFKMGQKCGVSEFCAKLGLHAHHPRNCLFYLRDKEPTDLQKLLDEFEIPYNTDPPEGSDVKIVCQVMEQKEVPTGLSDDLCGKEVLDGYGGLCRLHYVEYLGGLISKHNVDPLSIFNEDELELVLKRATIKLPPRCYRTKDSDYRKSLIEVIQAEMPLEKIEGM